MALHTCLLLLILASEWASSFEFKSAAECPERNLSKVEPRRHCRKRCSSNLDCKRRISKCLCDDYCGMSCFNPDRSCGELPQIAHGNEYGDGTKYGSTRYYKCYDGYIMERGSPYIKCRSDKKWSGTPPTCTERIPTILDMEIEFTEATARVRWKIDKISSAFSRIAYFAVTYSTNTNDVQSRNVTGQIVDLTNLKAGTIYQVNVTAITNAGSSSELFEKRFTTDSLRCGKITKHSERIVGGSAVDHAGDIPWQVSLRTLLYPNWEHFCGGTIISDSWILTAAHCVYRMKAHEIRVILGEHDITATEISEEEYSVSLIIKHPDFKHDEFRHPINDISLLKVSKQIYFNGYISPICLPSQEDDVEVGKMCTISGWGKTRYLWENVEESNNVLRSAKVPTISNTRCKMWLSARDSILSTNVCAGYKNGSADSCFGDSGGPLTCEDGKSHVIQGVISWGIGCGKKRTPGVYARVSRFVDWIYSTMKIHPGFCFDEHYCQTINKDLCAESPLLQKDCRKTCGLCADELETGIADIDDGCQGFGGRKVYLHQGPDFWLTRCTHSGCTVDTNGNAISLVRKTGHVTQQWTLLPNNGKCLLQADNGKFASWCMSCWNGGINNNFGVFLNSMDMNNAASLWQMERVTGNTYSFKQLIGQSYRYLSRCYGCAGWKNIRGPDNMLFAHGTHAAHSTIFTLETINPAHPNHTSGDDDVIGYDGSGCGDDDASGCGDDASGDDEDEDDDARGDDDSQLGEDME